MRHKQRLEKLEQFRPTPSRILPFRNNIEGEAELVAVVGGSTFLLEDYPDEQAFWAAIHADEKRAWEADPRNPDPIGGLLNSVAKSGKRIGFTKNL